MEKTISIVFMALMLLSTFAVPFALAEENVTEEINVSEEEVTETSPAENTEVTGVEEVSEEELGLNESVSNIQIAWKQFRMWFTFNQERKIEREMELARLRLIQAKIAAKNNNTAAMEKALEAHERIMNRVQNRMKAIEYAQKGNISAPVAKLVALEKAIQVHERRIAYLSNAIENANLTEAQRDRIQARISHIENVTAKLVEINEDKKEKLVTRIMAVTNMSEEEANALVAQRREQIKENIRERVKATVNKVNA